MLEKHIIVSSDDDWETVNNEIRNGWAIKRTTGPHGPWKGIVNYTVWLIKKEDH